MILCAMLILKQKKIVSQLLSWKLSQCIIENFHEDSPLSEMEFQCDLSLIVYYKIYVSAEKYPIYLNSNSPSIECLNALFSSTYLCKSLFSTMNGIKNKYRNRLTDHIMITAFVYE